MDAIMPPLNPNSPEPTMKYLLSVCYDEDYKEFDDYFVPLPGE